MTETAPRRDKAVDYAARIQRAADHIAAHLDAALTLERLADVACFSPHHFHRIYRGVMGETPDQTVRRLRLHRAAVALARGTAPLLQVAAQAGYGSVEAFSRAFSAAYGHPPAAYRAQFANGAAPDRRSAPAAATDRPASEETKSMYDVTVETAPGYRLLGRRHRGAYDDIGPVFERVFLWAGARDLIREDALGVGLYYDDPQTVPVGELRSFAGVAVDQATVLSPEAQEAGFEIAEVPAGPVAQILFKGPYAELEPVYRHLYETWLPEQGRAPADHPGYEIYLNSPSDTPPTELLTQVRVPLAVE